MKNLISVIVPAYNIENYLGRCIDSILIQEYEHIEIIIVDDGSSDGTGRILDEYVQEYPLKIKGLHLKNSGVTSARFSGVKIANGDWIGFVDGDDTIEPNMYVRLIQNGIEENADISHCGYRTIVNDGEREHYFYNTGKVVLQDRNQGIYDLLSGKYIEPGLCNKLYRKRLFESILENNSMDTSVRINEDLMLNYLLFAQANRSIYEDFCPYNYMTRTTSASRSGFQAYKVLDPVKVRKWILDRVEEEFKNIAWANYLRTCGIAYYSLYGSVGQKDTLSNLKMMIENKKLWKILERKELIKLSLIVYFPYAYQLLYAIYTKWFHKKVYE